MKNRLFCRLEMRLLAKSSNTLHSGIRTSPKISRRELENFLLQNQSLFKRNELSWVREIIRNLNQVSNQEQGEIWIDTIKFLHLVKEKRRRTHKYQCGWYMKLFKTLGASYSRKLFF